MKKLLILALLLGIFAFPAFAEEEVSSKELKKTAFSKEEIISTKTFDISAVDPKKVSKKNKGLIIYTKFYGYYTNTDTKGYEAVVVDNRVIQMNQSNSYIPQNGYVISGHGEAKKFILDNLFEGADVEIDFDNSQLKVITRAENYLYEANYRLENVKNKYADMDKTNIDTENIEFFIEKAENLLTFTKKLIMFEDYETARQMAKDTITYADMAQYFMLPYNPDEFRGIRVFPYQKNETEVRQAFNSIKNLGIENIFLEVYYNGLTIYKSEVQEKYDLASQNRYYGEFDALELWLDLAKDAGLNVYVTFNTFNLGNLPKSTIKESIVSLYPDWQYKNKKLKGYYLDAENEQVQRYLMALVDEIVKKYEVTNISITGFDLPQEKTLAVREFINKVTSFQRANEKVKIALDVYPFSSDFKNWNIDTNTVLCPVLTSSNFDFTQNFLHEVKNHSFGATIIPVYMEPYLEEKPRNLFEQISISRELGINGLILYNFDYLTKDFTNALKLSIFNAPSEKKENTVLLEMKFNESQTEENPKEQSTESEETKSTENEVTVEEEKEE